MGQQWVLGSPPNRVVQEQNISALPIVEDSGKLCGLITRSSLMTTLSHQYLDNQEGGL